MKKTVLAVCVAMVFTPGATFAENKAPNETPANASCETQNLPDNSGEGMLTCDEGMPDGQLAAIVASSGLMAAALAGAVHTLSDSDGGSPSSAGNTGGDGDTGGDEIPAVMVNAKMLSLMTALQQTVRSDRKLPGITTM